MGDNQWNQKLVHSEEWNRKLVHWEELNSENSSQTDEEKTRDTNYQH